VRFVRTERSNTATPRGKLKRNGKNRNISARGRNFNTLWFSLHESVRTSEDITVKPVTLNLI
jgi:hypothetical protein